MILERFNLQSPAYIQTFDVEDKQYLIVTPTDFFQVMRLGD